jgi:signal peptidase I
MDARLSPAELNRALCGSPARRHPRASQLVRIGLVALILALFVRAFLLEVVSIPSDSMRPTLEPGDQVLVNRLLYSGPRWGLLPRRPVRRGDVVLFRPPFDRRLHYVKRCVGLGGDWYGGGVLSRGEIWMEGDARERSLDSRRFGAISDSALEGRVLAVLWSRSAASGPGDRILRQVR